MIRKSEKLALQGELIRGRAPSGSELMFQHSLLCSIGLPRSLDVMPAFKRESEFGWVFLRAGSIDGEQQPLPYGPMARLMLILVSSIAVRTGKPEIELASAAQLLRQMGYDAGGQRYRKLSQLICAFASCWLEVGRDGGAEFRQPFKIYVSPSKTHRGEWSGRIVLGRDFFDDLLRNLVALDYRVLRALSGSALAIDIYTWLAGSFQCHEGGERLFSWQTLKQVFGHEYLGAYAMSGFIKAFKVALTEVLMVYPQANVLAGTEGVKLSCSLHQFRHDLAGRSTEASIVASSCSDGVSASCAPTASIATVQPCM